MLHQVLPGDSIVGKSFSLLWPARIAPGSLAAFTLRSGTPPGAAAPGMPAGPLTVSETTLANGHWAAAAGTDRDLLRFTGAPLESVRVEVREDPSDTWSHGIDRFCGPGAGFFLPSATVVEEAGPVRASLRIEAAFGASRLELSARLTADDPRMELELRVNWQERLRIAMARQ